jgi:hypothetical protein
MGQWETLGASDEWYTPAYIFEALAVRFDLDVAHPRDRQTHVPCGRFLSAGSLETTWDGFVWMNPPFGGRNSLGPWLDKFLSHGEGIALVPDRTSAPWFQAAASKAHAILFVSPKVKFERPDGSTGDSPANGTALLACGYRGVKALETGRKLGLLVTP